MKKFKAAILDMDGTLLDTMYIWRHLTREYLNSKNIPIPEEIRDKLVTMGIVRVVNLLQENFKFGLTDDELREELYAVLANYYRNNSVLKPGALNLLKKLQERNISTVILSATPEPLLRIALGKVGVEKYFSHGILSCASMKYTKFQPESFYAAIEHLKVNKDEVMVFEDAWYAANTAKQSGLAVSMIAEPTELKTAETRQLADFYAEKSWDEFPVEKFF
jgi:beta-phosphoglucomutase-like phosphatase (HAD superfamily)